MKIVTEDAAPVTRYRKAVPPNVAAAVAKSLEKLPADRFATAKDFAEALVNPGFTVQSGVSAASAARDAGWKRRFYLAAGIAVVLLGAAVALIARKLSMSADPSSTSASSLHLRLPLAPGDGIAVSPQDANSNADRPSRTAFAFSPDGKTLIFAGDRGGVRQLFQRSLAGETETPIPGTESGESPFFSPDGKSLGFWSRGVLRRLSLAGGPTTAIATVPRIIGASWGDGDRIVVGVPSTGLVVYSAKNAKPDTLAGVGAMLPQWLPDGKAILFTRNFATRALDRNSRLEVLSLEGGTPRVVMDDAADGRIVAPGLLLFARRGTLLGVPFDARGAEVKGSPWSCLMT